MHVQSKQVNELEPASLETDVSTPKINPDSAPMTDLLIFFLDSSAYSDDEHFTFLALLNAFKMSDVCMLELCLNENFAQHLR